MPPRRLPNVVKAVEYYVLTDDIKGELGGHPIKERNGKRVVLMEPEQAQYFLDLNVISDTPGKMKPGGALGEHRHKDKGGDKGKPQAAPAASPAPAAAQEEPAPTAAKKK